MKILLCPDKFKSSLASQKVCDALSSGLLSMNKNIEIVSHPMADGGDGSIEVLKSLLRLKSQSLITVDPLVRKIEATYHYTNDTAYIELASASGITLLDQNELNPLLTSTKGTGILIKNALEKGFQKIYLFIGGSATNDGGIGIAHALGFDFLDKQDVSLKPIGANLIKIHSIKNNSTFDFSNTVITVLCDVNNPMYGPEGAAHVYAPQKGASGEDILILDEGLKNYAEVLQSQFDIDLADQPGVGAAGAVSASLVALLNARLENGFEMLSKLTSLEDAIKNADLVITGEGKVDQTSFQGKVVGNVLTICQQNNVPCGIVAGMIGEIADKETEFNFIKSILDLAENMNEAMAFPEKFLFTIGQDIARQ